MNAILWRQMLVSHLLLILMFLMHHCYLFIPFISYVLPWSLMLLKYVFVIMSQTVPVWEDTAPLSHLYHSPVPNKRNTEKSMWVVSLWVNQAKSAVQRLGEEGKRLEEGRNDCCPDMNCVPETYSNNRHWQLMEQSYSRKDLLQY